MRLARRPSVGYKWDKNERQQLGLWLPCPYPDSLVIFLLSVLSVPPDLAVSWPPQALTRPGALAQLNSIDGLGEMGHLVILVLHTHKHRLWAPQDMFILSLQGDLHGRVVSALP